MANTSISMSINSKKKIKELANKHNVSVSELMEKYMTIGFIIDNYMDENSEFLIENPKGKKDQKIVLPIKELLGSG